MNSRWCTVDGVDIEYTDRGCGPTLVFVHGVYVTGAIWNDVAAPLQSRYRCVVPTWPHGAHRRPASTADLTARAAARRIVGFLEHLQLSDVTVVANDTGGGLVLAALGEADPAVSRITRLVLTNCDSYEHFPPRAFRPLVVACKVSPRLGSWLLWLLGSPLGRRGFLAVVCRHPIPRTRTTEVFGSFATSTATRRDGVRLTASLDPALTMAAAESIARWDGQVRLVWGDRDLLFPIAHGRRLERAFPHATLEVAQGSSTYVMLDASAELIRAIDGLERTSHPTEGAT